MRRLAFAAILLLIVSILLPARPLAQELKPSAVADDSLSGALVLSKLTVEQRCKIDPDLLKAFAQVEERAAASGNQPEPVSFLVYLLDKAPIDSLPRTSSLRQRRELLVSQLRQAAAQGQVEIVRDLNLASQAGHVARFKSYWIFNGLAVDADLYALLRLAQRADVETIRLNRTRHLSPPQPTALSAEGILSDNIAQVGADEVWDTLGITGQGVVIANMDSGVDWTHPALQTAYRGYDSSNPDASSHDYNWFDATGTYLAAPGPNQAHISAQSDHGTHTMGVLVGYDPATGRRIGMAPGAQWIAAKVFDDQGDSTDEWIHAGFQWCLAPTDLNGESPDPSRAPDIVNNSWGDDNGADLTFRQDLAAWNAAGIFSAWAGGNAGPTGGTINSPGSYAETVAVGAVNSNDEVASFSSRGPSVWNDIKPDVMAPGMSIYSSVAGGGYESGWNGTSMATPHVAGLAALILEGAKGSLSISATRYAMTSTAVPLGIEGPDNTYGYGRIDALQAVRSVISAGTFQGRVVDDSTEQGVAGAEITMVNQSSGGTTHTRSQTDGSYSFGVAAGVYDVSVTLFGYEQALARDIDVLAQTTTQLDFRLLPLASGTVQGHVVSEEGTPLAGAVVQVRETPLSSTTDEQGAFTLRIPVGAYDLRLLPAGAGYRGVEVAVSIQPDETLGQTWTLPAAQRVLLVNADAWLGENPSYYGAGLEESLYGYDSWSILSPPSDIPTEPLLSTYDTVIWAQPRTSPGYIGAWGHLGGFLQQGGRLLISGQDIGYWDVGYGSAPSQYAQYLHAAYIADSASLDAALGQTNTPFAGIRLVFGGEDSANNQDSPDLVTPADPLAQAGLATVSGEALGLMVEACNYQALYCTFGLEGVSTISDRGALIAASLDWFADTDNGPKLLMSAAQSGEGVKPGTTTSIPIQIAHQGDGPIDVELALASPGWPITIVSASGEELSRIARLGPCQVAKGWVRVEVPTTARLGEEQVVRLTALSSDSAMAPTSLDLHIVISQGWVRRADLPSSRYRSASVATDCQIYTFGGLSEYDYAMSAVSRYDLQTGQWQDLVGLPVPCADAASVRIGDEIYVIGGHAPGESVEYLNNVQVFDLRRGTWRQSAPLPVALSGAAAAEVDGDIFVFGGANSLGVTNMTRHYSPSTGQWQTLAPAPVEQLSFANAQTLGNSIYVAGGWPAKQHLFRYTPGADQWEIMAPLLQGRHSFAMVSDGRYLFVAGGGQEESRLASVERFDPAQAKWISLPDMSFGSRLGTSGAYVSGRFYVVGGSDGSVDPYMESLDIAPPFGGSSLQTSSYFAQPGDTIDMAIDLRNPTQSDVTAHWALPVAAEFQYEPGTGTTGIGYDPDARVLGWTGLVPARGSLHFAISMGIMENAPPGRIITSTMTVSDSGCFAPEFSAVTAIALPSLASSLKTVNRASAPPGENLSYTIRVTNDSPFALEGVELRDPLPEQTELVAGSVVNGAYDARSNSVTWRGNLPAAELAPVSYSWVSALDGTDLNLGDDACAGPRSLGFEFAFYGRTYRQIYINSNGMILFDGCSASYGNTSIPNTSAPNGFVAPFWDDLRPGTDEGAVYMQVFGEAPHRYAVIEWHQVRLYSQPDPQTFEAILYEGSNRVIFQYQNMLGLAGTGAGATIGIENQDGSQGVLYLYNGQPDGHQVSDQTALEIVHPDTRKESAHQVSYTVRVKANILPLTTITNTAFINYGELAVACSASTVVQSADLRTSTRSTHPERVLSGDSVTCTIRLVNTGSADASDATLVEQLPQGLELIPGTLSDPTAEYNATARQITWQGSVPTDPAGVLLTYQATVAAGLAANTQLTSRAVIREQGVLMATLESAIMANPVDLTESTFEASSDAAALGATVDYVAIIRNSGLYAASNIVAENHLPAELALDITSVSGAAYDAETRRLSWLGELAPGASHIIQYRAATQGLIADGTLLTNTMQIAAESCPALARSAVVRVEGANLSTSSMSVTPTWVLPGGRARFTLRLLNSGSRATEALLTNPMPAGLQIVSGSLYTSSGTVDLHDGSITWRGNIRVSGMIIIRYEVIAPDADEPLSVHNVANLSDADGFGYALSSTLRISEGQQLLLPLLLNSR